MKIIRGILKEAEIIGGLHGEDVRLRGLVYPCDHVCVKVGQRAKEYLVFSLKKEKFSQLIRCQGLGTHIILFGEPKSLLSQLEPSFGPLPGFALPLNIGTEYRRARWHDLRRK